MYQGNIFEIPLGQGGLVGTRNQAAISPDRLILAHNIMFDGRTIRKEGGAIKYNSTSISGSPTVLGGWHRWPSESVQRMIVALSDGTLKKDTGGGTFGTTLKSGLTMTDVVPIFVEGGKEAAAKDRKLFIFNGKDQVQVLAADGTSTTNLGAVAVPGAPTAALASPAAPGNVDNGAHSWKITFVVGGGQTSGGTTSNQVTVVDKTVNGQIQLTNIPLGPDGTTTRNVYRTVAGDTGTHKLVGTISDNVTTTFTDNVADASLGANVPSSNTATTAPSDWSGSSQPSFGLIHRGRLWAGGNVNDPHRLYYPTTADHENFVGTGSGSISIFPGEGERLTGAISFNGLIVAWKFPTGIYLADTTDPTAANWSVVRISKGVGGVSPAGHVQVDKDVLFLDATGHHHLLSAVQEFGDASTSDITHFGDLYSFVEDNINLGRLKYARAVYYAARREAHFALASLGSSVNASRLVIDLNLVGTVRFRYSNRDVAEGLWLRTDVNSIQRLVAGDNAGFVWQLDQATRSKDGVGYNGVAQTPHMDFGWLDPGFSTKRKIGQFLEVVVEPKGNWNASADIYWDGKLAQTTYFNMGSAGAVLGSFVLGSDKLGADQIINRKRRIVGSGRRFSVAFRNSGAGEDFSIGRCYLHAKVGDERESE